MTLKSETLFVIDAIQSIHPKAEFVVGETYESLDWHSKDIDKPTKSQFDEALAKIKSDWESKKYQRDRAVAYDPIPEQLDQIYHDIDGWKAKIKAVKDKYPKP